MKTGKRHTLLSIVLLGALLLGAPFAVHAACISDPNEYGYNKDLKAGCGQDIILVLDESGSIVGQGAGSGNFRNDVMQGARSLLESIKNTGSRVVLVEFATNARLVQLPGVAVGTYLEVTDSTLPTFFSYLTLGSFPNNCSGNLSPSIYSPHYDSNCSDLGRTAGYTNWQSALNLVRTIHEGTAPARGPANMVHFMTDGNPTLNDGCPGPDTNLGCAVYAANALKNSDPGGSGENHPHLFVVAVGSSINTNNIRDISGCDELTLPADLPEVLRSDYTTVAFDKLEVLFRQISFATCSPSLTLLKTIDPDGPDFPGIPVETADIPFSATVVITDDPSGSTTPAADNYEWLDPQSSANCPTPDTGNACPGPGTADDPDDRGTTQNGATDTTPHTGILGFAWVPNDKIQPKPWNSKIVLKEAITDPYYFRQMNCTREYLNLDGDIESTTFHCQRIRSVPLLPDSLHPGCSSDVTDGSEFDECGRQSIDGYGPVICEDFDLVDKSITIPTRFGDILTCEVINDDVTRLPVTLNHFSSSLADGGIEFKWDTLSETDMLGFRLWAVVEGQRVTLGERLVLSNSSTSVTPQSYKVSRSVTDLVAPPEAVGITSVDIDGAEQHFGPYKIGETFGEQVEPKAIDWETINASVDEEMERAGYRKSGKRWVRQGAAAASGDSGVGDAEITE